MRFPITLSLILLCLLMSCQKQESAPTRKPQLRESTPAPEKSTLQKSYFLKHHFGDVKAGEILTCSLELKNETDKSMTFGFSHTTCGSCLTVKSKPAIIDPGETGIFELEFNTAGRRGATPQNAYFWDAEPKTILVVADIGATVRAVWTDPEMISLGNLSTSKPQNAKLYVLASGLPDAKVTSVQCETPWLMLVSKPVETSRELISQNIQAIDFYEIEWTGKEAKPGNLASKIIIHVQSSDGEKIFEIPVNGYLFGDVEIVPSNVVFGQVTKSEVVRTLMLTFNRSDIDAAKIKCVADHSAIQINLEKSKEDSRQFVLTMCLTPPVETEDQLIKGTIMGTDDSGEVVFTVPYIAVVDAE